MNSTSLTRLAMLGTISELHRQPLPYDLACLRKVVTEHAPDLLCAEISPEAWEHGNLTAAELEVHKVLAPVAASTDIVLMPVAPSDKHYDDFAADAGWRQRVAQFGVLVLRWGQRKAATPQAVNGFWFETFCHTVCALTEAFWTAEERAAWDQQNRTMAENILQVVRRDPGRRVLVVVQCQRLHRLAPLLKGYTAELELVRYQAL